MRGILSFISNKEEIGKGKILIRTIDLTFRNVTDVLLYIRRDVINCTPDV